MGKLKRIAVLLLICAGLTGPAVADQTAPELDELFGRLQVTKSDAEARALEAGIWRLWLQSDSPTVALLMNQGIDAMAAGEHKQSLAIFDTVVQLAPNYAEGWNKRATVLFLMGRLKESIADCGKVLALEPRHFGALSGLGLIYTQLKQPKKALDAFQRVLEVDPHSAFAREQVKILKKQVQGEKI